MAKGAKLSVEKEKQDHKTVADSRVAAPIAFLGAVAKFVKLSAAGLAK